jgi:hypothetical protein
MRWLLLITIGVKLNGKFGVTGETLGWYSDELLDKYKANAKARGDYVRVVEPEALNLDGLFEDDVEKESKRKDMPQAYCHCAKATAAAMRARLNGDMQAADRHQANAEKAYLQLPESWRW